MQDSHGRPGSSGIAQKEGCPPSKEKSLGLKPKEPQHSRDGQNKIHPQQKN